ncbi:MAG TPA: 2-oxoglutarate and iron-dependent oxygenase domain-containing protein [Chitinophagales bacterium]|nr:2-oxoglutarate and iron-dependent oxygenase domain-containing protein [Chitinophagales bacterium]HNL84079.1 2-oxoglutarate and iron-dependent oxygenase domain-containing protein [Chitinophagales bacterium]
MSYIPVLDLADYLSGDESRRQKFIQGFGKAYSEIGFAAIENHGIDKDLIDKFYSQVETFFAMPTDTKLNYEKIEYAGQRGYTSFGREKAKQSEVADLKEFWQIGQYIEDGEIMPVDDYPDNIEVKELPEFNETGRLLYKNFEVSGRHLLRAIAEYLHLDVNYFDAKIHNGNSILRAIHYPPITKEPESAIRAEAHEDINLITLLVGASADGLQVMDVEGTWHDAKAEPHQIMVNVGDMLQRLCNNKLKSTTHRVVNPPKEKWHTHRYSIPFFLHPRSEVRLDCLENCVDEQHPLAYAPISAGEYLDERLREIGLKK